MAAGEFYGADAAKYKLNGRILGGLTLSGSSNEFGYANLGGGTAGLHVGYPDNPLITPASAKSGSSFGTISGSYALAVGAPRAIDNSSLIAAMNSVYDYATGGQADAPGQSGSLVMSNGSKGFVATSRLKFDGSAANDGLFILAKTSAGSNVGLASHRAGTKTGVMLFGGLAGTSGTFATTLSQSVDTGGGFESDGSGNMKASAFTTAGSIAAAQFQNGSGVGVVKTGSIGTGGANNLQNGTFSGNVVAATFKDRSAGPIQIKTGSIEAGINATFTNTVAMGTYRNAAGTQTMTGSGNIQCDAATFSGAVSAGRLSENNSFHIMTGSVLSTDTSDTAVFSGALTAGTLGDFTGSISSGAVSGMKTVTASGQLTAASLKLHGTNFNGDGFDYVIDVIGGILTATPQ